MSRFASSRCLSLLPYTPGEQPLIPNLIKLNTNENPYPPIPEVVETVAAEVNRLPLYPDPTYKALREAYARAFLAEPNQLLFGNGSDDVLSFVFQAFGDRESPMVCPEISYGFYPVFAQIYGVPLRQIPLTKDLRIRAEDYYNASGTIVIANPNAPTGLSLSEAEIRAILLHNKNRLLVLDEAYAAFAEKSYVSLISEFDNLLIVGTFSKMASLAGGRLGYAVGRPEVIADLERIRYSTNPYNISRLTVAAALALVKRPEAIQKNVREIIKTREATRNALIDLGFEVTDSKTNFLFAKPPKSGAKAYFEYLRSRGILVRYLSAQIDTHVRISIGTPADMETLIRVTKTYLEEQA